MPFQNFQPTPVQPTQFDFGGGQQQPPNVMQSIGQGLQSQGLMQQNQIRALQLEEAQNFQTALGSFVNGKKTEEDFASLVAATPLEHMTQMAKMWETFSEPKRKDALKFSSEIVAALTTNNPAMASKIAMDRAGIYEAAGMQDEADKMKSTAKMATENPDFLLAQTSIGLVAAGGKDVLQGALDLKKSRESSALAVPQLQEAQAKAQTAATAARYSEREHAAELAKKGWDIQRIQTDIAGSKEDRRIKILEAEMKKTKTASEMQELELKIDKAKNERGEKVRENAANLDASLNTIDNMLGTIDMVLKTKPNVISRATGPAASVLPTISADTANFEESVETLKNQTFLAQVPLLKGFGVISDSDAKKLTHGLRSLSLRQGGEQLTDNIKEIRLLIEDNRSTLLAKYGATAAEKPIDNTRQQRNVRVKF